MESSKISILIIYRDRGIQTAKNCLISILSQDHQDFELVFIDYGSKEGPSADLENIVNSFQNSKYQYVFTRGFPFNKAHGLNIALDDVKGEYLLVCDVDLILPKNFVSGIKNYLKPRIFYNYRCYYLSQDFDIKTIESQGFFKRKNLKFPLSDDTGVGLIIAPTQAVKDIGGYNQFFQYWGFEDLDLHRRLKSYGLGHGWIETDHLYTFHQWHAKHSDTMPLGWFDTMKDYFDSSTNDKIDVGSNGKNYRRADRPALELFLNGEYKNGTKIEINEDRSLFEFITGFYRTISSNQSKILWMSFANTGNKKKNDIISRSKRFIKGKITKETDLGKTNFDFSQLRDFFYYFLNQEKTNFEDYFYEFDHQKLRLILIKKNVKSD